MYSVTKKVEFCYGHRLLDHAGPCRHPHGHNAVAEIEMTAPTLDAMNMVIDFAELKRRVESWIEREIDHRMILHADDPLVRALRELGEEPFVVESNPTAERIARLIFDAAHDCGLTVSRVTVWETPSASATYAGASR
jgi:6-pyruvoyltetrahydropterin/6-carboxytetrahydropterin synthase